MEVQWFCVEQAPSGQSQGQRRRLPEWIRSVAIGGDGAIFAAAEPAGNEQYIVLCASRDGVPVVINTEHAYVPVKWMAREYPETARLVSSLEARLPSMVD